MCEVNENDSTQKQGSRNNNSNDNTNNNHSVVGNGKNHLTRQQLQNMASNSSVNARSSVTQTQSRANFKYSRKTVQSASGSFPTIITF